MGDSRLQTISILSKKDMDNIFQPTDLQKLLQVYIRVYSNQRRFSLIKLFTKSIAKERSLEQVSHFKFRYLCFKLSKVEYDGS